MANPYFDSQRSLDAVQQGASRDVLRGPSWERRAHGLVAPRDRRELDPVDQRLADALGLQLPGTVIGGWASMRLQGNRYFGNAEALRPVPIHCLPGTQLRRRNALVEPLRGLVHPDEIIDLGGVLVTTMARAVYDEMRTCRGLRSAVQAADMAISTVTGAPHTTADRIAAVISSHFKTRGIVQARTALSKSSSRSASPLETSTRLVAGLDAGFEKLLVNQPVFDLRERLLGIADLLDPESGTVFETDGAHHRELAQYTDDHRREEGFENAGIVVCRVTSLDHQDRWRLVGRMQSARRSARRGSRRDWTTDAPAWWAEWEPARRWQ